MDADERIDDDDAAALRSFVDGAARPDVAYGFRVCRMIGDLEHFDLDSLWVYRLFAYSPGQRFPDAATPLRAGADQHRPPPLREHDAPYSAPRRHHRGAAQARFAKYTEADPGNEFQPDYTNLLAAADRGAAGSRAQRGLPVVPDGRPSTSTGRCSPRS